VVTVTPRYLSSPCCGAAVVGMVDVTVHPRYCVDGSLGPIIDTLAGIKYDVTRSAAPDPHEAYCAKCGAPVAVPHECNEPWRHQGG
jgi:hypothetical protein